MKPSRLALLALLLVSPFIVSASTPVTYDAAEAFSLASNPNNEWQYGTTGTTLGGAFAPFANVATSTFQNVNVGSWYGDESMFGDLFPLIGKNVSNVTQTVSTGDIVLGPLELFAHPGPSGTFSVLRFTAPSPGSYVVDGSFEGRDQRGVTTDVHIVVNGTAIFSGNVVGFGPSSEKSLSTVVLLQTADTVDFVVGVGANGNFENDSTSISATVTLDAVGSTPTTRDQCKMNGWRNFSSPRVFKNQGDCIQFVNTGK